MTSEMGQTAGQEKEEYPFLILGVLSALRYRLEEGSFFVCEDDSTSNKGVVRLCCAVVVFPPKYTKNREEKKWEENRRRRRFYLEDGWG